jgi:hypothetical protein
MTMINELHATLDRRATPQQVAAVIVAGGGAGRGRTGELLRRVAYSRPGGYVSSMPADFERADDCRAQLAAAGRMFGVSVDGIDPGDVTDMRDFITLLGRSLGGWMPGDDWKRDRLDKAARRSAPRTVIERGLASKRQYNRHVRVLRHLWDKAQRMGGMQEGRRLVLIGRSGFAFRITAARMARDPLTAMFVAYYAARRNERREFTLNSRGNAIDELAEALLADALAGADADVEMLAWVYPRPQVLARLTAEQLGRLLGDWHKVMADTAAQLKAAWPGDENVNRASMIVRRGMDSSTWNTMASAYNAARSAWIGCVAAAGALPLLEPALPGKVMRLMAADLAYWHRASGGDVDPNTAVFADLPLPWEVLEGRARCTAADVRAACAEAGMAADGSGWTAPLPDGQVAEYRPTPELVHGIAVADPAWAGLLRRGGAFSGKKVRAGYAADMARVPGEIIGERPAYDPLGAYLGTTRQS